MHDFLIAEKIWENPLDRLDSNWSDTNSYHIDTVLRNTLETPELFLKGLFMVYTFLFDHFLLETLHINETILKV